MGDKLDDKNEKNEKILLTNAFKNANIENIYVNGNQALNLYNKYLLPIIKIKATLLPSTSPANATYSFEKLCTIWQAKIKNNQ